MTEAGRARRRKVAAGMVAVVVGGYLAVVAAHLPVSGADANDGPPQLFFTTPQVARTAGGTPFRIYGSGLLGTTSVTFGGVPVTKFKVIDSGLMTVIAPPAPGGVKNGSVPIEIVDNQGHGGSCEQTSPPQPAGCQLSNPPTGSFGDAILGVFYTDATMTLSPDTGLTKTSTVTVDITGYQPNASTPIVEMSPIVGFLEGGPDFASVGYGGPPPYVVPQAFTRFDAQGHLNQQVGLSALGDFNAWGAHYDTNSTCPPNQDTADHGLPQCLVGVGQLAVGTMEHHITFADNPTPTPPTLTLSASSAKEGDTVDLSGANWTNNAYFGSDTSAADPGETQLVVEICKGDATGCKPATASGHVDLTRYQTSSTTIPIQPVFKGATLSGSLVVDNTADCAPDCLVQVRQEGYDYDDYNGKGTGTFISATALLSVSVPETTTSTTSTTSPGSTTTSTSPSTATSSTTTTRPPTATTTSTTTTTRPPTVTTAPTASTTTTTAAGATTTTTSPASAVSCGESSGSSTSTSTTFLSTAASPSAQVNPASIQPGGDVSVSGGGFDAGQRLDITLCSSPTALGTTTADPSGSYSANVTVPADTATGDHMVLVSGPGGTPVARAALTVVDLGAAGNASTPSASGAGGRSTSAGSSDPSGTTSSRGSLSRTGADVARMVFYAGLCLLIGVAAVRAGRRRHR